MGNKKRGPPVGVRDGKLRNTPEPQPMVANLVDRLLQRLTW